ncbi:putative F-box protein At1g19160 [Oryza glaberrima]|uniref:F-box domain-containing protein n=1 Tax=Oryza glaberrima TaxID=4538 RepID=I1R6I2_ORYGL|nr:putative F-box protein At1g19160 [Oryza glaberrima]
MDDSIMDGLPTDAFVEILLRLPPSARRRSRLVCRRWRDVVDARTPEGQSHRAKALVFFLNRSGHSPEPRCSAHVFDDLSPPSSSGREIWNSGTGTAAELAMVGCCNGVIALWEEGTGRLTLVNPSTGETLAIPPPPRLPPKRRRRRTPLVVSCLSFGYHPITGKYKIVHLPADDAMAAASSSSWCSPLDVVKVFTLGDVGVGDGATWREVAAPPGSSCHVRLGVVSLDGAAYWVAADNAVMSFDLEHERVVAVEAPLPAMPLGTWLGALAVVGGRLGVAVMGCADSYPTTTIVEVQISRPYKHLISVNI